MSRRIDYLLNKYQNTIKQHPNVPKCEACGIKLTKDLEWVCPNCGLVHSPILESENEPKYVEVKESNFDKYLRESLHDKKIHARMKKLLYNKEYNKDYHQKFTGVTIERNTQQRLKNYCIENKLKQKDFITHLVSLVLDVLEEKEQEKFMNEGVK